MSNMKTHCLAGNQYHMGELCPIARLPSELLVGVLLLVLPNIYAVVDKRQCQEYMAHLYTLRSVSKKWRGVVDGTPILWRLISSSLPLQVNVTSVSRSLNTPLVVIYDATSQITRPVPNMDSSREPQSFPSSIQSFTELADVVRDRWSSLTFKLDPSFISQLLAKPAPQLQILTFVFPGSMPAQIPQINLLGGCTEKLRHVRIERIEFPLSRFNRIPMFWPNGAFHGLKSLHFSHIHGPSFTTRYILEVLGGSPELETLVLNANVFQHDPNDSNLPQVILPRLQTLQYGPHHSDAVDQTLRHITFLPDSMKSLTITNHTFTSLHIGNIYEEFLTTVLSLLAPVLRRLHERCGGSSFHLFLPIFFGHGAQFRWDGELEDLKLKLFIPMISPSTALKWVDRVLSLADPGITLLLPGKQLCGDTLIAMQSMQSLDKIIVHDCSPEYTPNVLQLLDALGAVEPANPGSTSPTNFPSLRTLEITDCGTNLDPIIGMLRSRFSGMSDQDAASRVPDLSLNLTFVDRGQDQDYDPNNIPSFELVQGMRTMPGVKEVRLGSVSNIFGRLAAVWDEGLMTPVWG